MRFGPLRLNRQPASLRSRGFDVSRREFEQGLIWVLRGVLGCKCQGFIGFGAFEVQGFCGGSSVSGRRFCILGELRVYIVYRVSVEGFELFGGVESGSVAVSSI